MNDTNEPEVELLEPPAGMKWEYRGKGWVTDRPATYTYYTRSGFTYWLEGIIPEGNPDYHYWEAVPVGNPISELQKDVQISLLIGDRDRYEAKCGYLEALNADYRGQVERAYEGRAAAEKECNRLRDMLDTCQQGNRDRDAENAELKQWKQSAITEAAKLDLQAIGTELGLTVGTDIAPEILPKIRELKRQMRESLFKELQKVVDEAAAKRFLPQKPDHTEGGKYRMLEEEVAQLKEWKSQAIISCEGNFDLQEIGTELGMPWGMDIRPNILKYVKEMKAKTQNHYWEDYAITLVGQRDSWKETAAQHLRNEQYYRDLLDQCGQAIGHKAYEADDGTQMKDVLVAKVPELVKDLCAQRTTWIRQQINEEDATFGGMSSIPVFKDPHGVFAEPKIDHAQQAKDILQARFVAGFPTFREISLDQLVDLIIKAAKQ